MSLAPLPDDEPLSLPPAWVAPARPPVPLVASIVPVIGAGVLWVVTGSMMALWLAALGPLIAVAAFADGRRAAVRERRHAEASAVAARSRVSAAIDERHARERARRRALHPDAATFVLREDEIWRPVPGRAGLLVIGSGDEASGIVVSGGDGSADSRALRARASTLTDAPVTVDAADGVAVVGPAVVASAVLRGLVLQLCLAVPPGELRIAGALRGENAWAERLPHRRSAAGATLALVAPGEAVPADADIALVRVTPGDPVPPRCGVVVTVPEPARANVDIAGHQRPVRVEAVSTLQADGIAGALAERAASVLGLAPHDAPPVSLAALLPHDDMPAPAGGARSRTSLAAAFATEGIEPFVVDLVRDGPHAVVAGVTGSGKSELLISWVLALCATHSTGDVSFLLADFKGGTAFDPLADLPHVTGVITDLDGAGARRAIESLRAEIRWREAELSRCGARDILDSRVELPRLVVVVDEFAALLTDHPELHAVFTDVAARGRALGMHLVLGTQRVVGVMRDALLANCPLRLSLRVTDPLDSRAVVGVDEAAQLSGALDARGAALVRRASDAAARRVRIALSTADDVARIGAHADAQPRPRRPWLPDLPRGVTLAELRSHPDAPVDGLLLGLADEPERQRQRPVAIGLADRGVLVVGGAGSGKSTALESLAAQAGERIVRVPSDPEAAWDALARLADEPVERGTLVVVDDLDALPPRFPAEYAHELVERLERVFRGAGDRGILVVASAQRLTGAAARLGELLPRRVVLATSSRAEHLAAGGDASGYAPDAPPGRARLDGRAVQLATTDAPSVSERRTFDVPVRDAWTPRPGITGVVARRSSARGMLAAWEARAIRVVPVETLLDAPAAGDPCVAVGDPDEWQRHWRALAAVRDEHTLVIDVSCAADYRALTADRALPPYCEAGRGRAWLLRGGEVERIAPAVADHGVA